MCIIFCCKGHGSSCEACLLISYQDGKYDCLRCLMLQIEFVSTLLCTWSCSAMLTISFDIRLRISSRTIQGTSKRLNGIPNASRLASCILLKPLVLQPFIAFATHSIDSPVSAKTPPWERLTSCPSVLPHLSSPQLLLRPLMLTVLLRNLPSAAVCRRRSLSKHFLRLPMCPKLPALLILHMDALHSPLKSPWLMYPLLKNPLLKNTLLKTTTI